MALGLRLGADVPVFVYGQNAFATGVGEELTPLELPDNWYVVLRPDVHIPTAQIFSSPLLTRNSPPSIMRTLETTQQRRNDMQSVVRKDFPVVDQALTELGQYGPALMTGSGSCIFLECDTQDQASKVFEQLSTRWRGFVTKGLQHHPLFDKS
jgi:4-diphosphocytidyl-2-C-methyl-D-erythritol kinase